MKERNTLLSPMLREEAKQTLSISIVSNEKDFLLILFKIPAYERCCRRERNIPILFKTREQTFRIKGFSTLSMLLKIHLYGLFCIRTLFV